MRFHDFVMKFEKSFENEFTEIQLWTLLFVSVTSVNIMFLQLLIKASMHCICEIRF